MKRRRGNPMFGQTTLSNARSSRVVDFDRRLRAVEQGLERARGQAASRASSTADFVTEAVTSVLNKLGDRLPAASFGDEAAKLGDEAARLSQDAMRRLSKGVQHQPLVTVTVAVGVGLLIGLVVSRR